MMSFLKKLYVRFRLFLIQRKLQKDGFEGTSLNKGDWAFLAVHDERLYENLQSLGGGVQG